MSWLKDIADKLAANLREAGWPSSSDPVVNPEGKIPEPRRFSTTGFDLARPNADETILTPSVADPVGAMLGVVPARRNPPAQSNFNALDHIITECKHPGIQIVRFPNGETSHHCTLCAKTWGSLAEAVDDAEQTQPISMTEMGEGGIPAVISEMASEMSYRLGQSIAALADATNPGTVAATFYDRQFRDSLRSNTPFGRNSLPTQEGGTMQHFNINAPQQDPALHNAGSKLRQAQREASEAMGRRHKAMEDAARAAAAAFDAGIEAERNPVKLDGDRKLKAI